MGGWSTINGGNAILWTYFGNDNQKWSVQDAGDGYYRIVNKYSNLSLDVEGILTTNGASIWQWEYVGGANQQFKPVSFSSAKSKGKEEDPLLPYIKKTSIDKELGVAVYPNPFTEFVNIYVKNSSYENISIKIFDISGKLIDSKFFSSNTIKYENSDLETGIYILQIWNENIFLKSKKLIKE